jgi:hypothetical protein
MCALSYDVSILKLKLKLTVIELSYERSIETIIVITQLGTNFQRQTPYPYRVSCAPNP